MYGFRITFQQIFAVGMQGFWADVIMISTTYLLGYYLGTRIFKLDKDLCMLTSIGSSVCGAAAVLGTDSMLKADSHKVSLAVSTVVLFGTISMFLYPFPSYEKYPFFFVLVQILPQSPTGFKSAQG